LHLKIDPPWEWSWQRRVSMIVLIFLTLWITVAATEDLWRPSDYPRIRRFVSTQFGSTIVALMIAVGIACVLRLLLWVFPEKRPTDSYGLEILLIIVFVWFGAVVLVTERMFTEPGPSVTSARPMTDEEAAKFVCGIKKSPGTPLTAEEVLCLYGSVKK